MSLIERTRTLPNQPVHPGHPWKLLTVAAGYGAIGALALVLLLLIPAVAGWAADPQSTVSWTAAMSFAPALWVLAHRGSVQVPTDQVSVTLPLLLLTGLAVLLARTAAASSFAHIHEEDERAWWHLPAAFVGGYAGTGVLLSLFAWLGPARPNPIFVVPGAALVSSLGMLWALLRARHREQGGIADHVLDGLEERVPRLVQRALRPALRGAIALLLLGTLVVAVMVATGFGRISEVGAELGVNGIGGAVLTLGQLAALPNAVAWSALWTTGAAVQIGPVAVGHAAVTPGVLPMIPALGALPEAGAGPAWAPFVPVLPILVGAWIGRSALEQVTALSSVKVKVATATTAAALAGLMVLLVGFVGAMGVSGGTLSYVGPSLTAIPLAVLEPAIGAALAAFVLHHWRLRR